MENISRLSLLKSSILRHSGRGHQGHVHVLLSDEPSETAGRWLASVKREAEVSETGSDIPYIDDVDIPDSAFDIPDNSDKIQSEGNPEPSPDNENMSGNFLVNFFVRGIRGRRGTIPDDDQDQEAGLRSSLYERRMARSVTEGCVSILGRAETVVEQAEAKGAFKRRNSVKKSMIRKIGKSIETLSQKERRISKEDDRQVLSTPRKNQTSDDDNDSSKNENIKGEASQRPLIRSVSEIGLMKLASIRFKKKETDHNKKTMFKDWTKTYEDMCDRAQKLEQAIKEAESEELEVKPVNTFKSCAVKENCESDAWKQKQFNSGSFYSLQSITSSDTDVEDVDIDTDHPRPRMPTNNATKKKNFKERLKMSLSISSSEG